MNHYYYHYYFEFMCLCVYVFMCLLPHLYKSLLVLFENNDSDSKDDKSLTLVTAPQT